VQALPEIAGDEIDEKHHMRHKPDRVQRVFDIERAQRGCGAQRARVCR